MPTSQKELISAGAILSHLRVRDKRQAIKKLAEFASMACNLPEKEIYSVLMEREEAGGTGVGNGVSIPQGRFAGLKEVHVFFARLDTPINFGADDAKNVDLIFVLLAPTKAEAEHLKMLSIASKILRDKNLCAKLRAADTAEEIHSLIIAEQSVMSDKLM